MRRLNRENINTSAYFDSQFADKSVDMENTLRQDRYLDILSRCDVEKVVELGCGMSAFLPMAAEQYREVWGLDFAPKAVASLQEQFPNIEFVVGDATATPFDDEQFDAVVAGEIIEHLEEPQALVDEMARICRRGGIMVLSTPHLEFDDPEHIWEFDPEDLLEMFSPYGRPHYEVIESELFEGRKYIFVWCKRKR